MIAIGTIEIAKIINPFNTVNNPVKAASKTSPQFMLGGLNEGLGLVKLMLIIDISALLSR